MIKTLGGRRLSRTSAHKKATLRALVTSLLLHEKIQTTVAKAKELRRVADRLITQAKKGDHHLVRRTIQDKVVFRKLIEVIAPRYTERHGGFTQMFRLERRRGDNSEVSMIRLIS